MLYVYVQVFTLESYLLEHRDITSLLSQNYKVLLEFNIENSSGSKDVLI